MNLRDCRHLLLFGGTFDPPHVAHLMLPMLAMKAIGADAVAYIPAAISPHKTDQPPTAAAHRAAMLRLMLEGEPQAIILTDEIDRFAATGEPSYTVQTLEALRKRLGPDVRLRLLIGTDQLKSFDRWRDYERIIELAEPVVMIRPPMTRATMLANLPAGFEAARWEPRMVDMRVMDVSATLIRERIAQGKPIAGLVTPQVEAYIREHGLYGAHGQ